MSYSAPSHASTSSTWPLAVSVGSLLLLAACTAPTPPQPPVSPVALAGAPSPYRYPLNSPGTQFSGLPPAVQNTVRAQVGAEPIFEIRKDPGPIYKIYFVEQNLPPLIIAPDGSVLNPDLTVAVAAPEEAIGSYSGGTSAGLKPGDLPPTVMKVVQVRAPNSEIAFIRKEKAGDDDVFVISFKDAAQYPTMRVKPDGTVLDEPPTK